MNCFNIIIIIILTTTVIQITDLINFVYILKNNYYIIYYSMIPLHSIYYSLFYLGIILFL